MAASLPKRLIGKIVRCLVGSRNMNCVETISDVYRHLYNKHRDSFRALDIRNEADFAAFLAFHPTDFRCFISDGKRYVSPTTDLSVCTSHSKYSGSCTGACRDLHMCMFYLLSGQCPFGAQCLFGHSLDQDLQRLERYNLDRFSLTEFRRLLCLPWVRRGVTVPRVCRYYNKLGGCTKAQTCLSLHICGYYMNGMCKFGTGCKRNHDIDDKQVSNVLTMYGVVIKGRPLTSILNEVRSFYADDNPDGYDYTSDSSVSETTPPSGRRWPQNRTRSGSVSAVRGFAGFRTQLDPSQTERKQIDRRSRRDDFGSVQDRARFTRSRATSVISRPCTSSGSMPVLYAGSRVQDVDCSPHLTEDGDRNHHSRRRPVADSSSPSYRHSPAFLALSTAPQLHPDSFVRNETVDSYQGVSRGQLGATRPVSSPADTQRSQVQPMSGVPLQQAVLPRMRQVTHQVAQLNLKDPRQLQSLERMCELGTPPYLSVTNHSTEEFRDKGCLKAKGCDYCLCRCSPRPVC